MSGEQVDSATGLLLFASLGAAVWLRHNNRKLDKSETTYEGGCHCGAVTFTVRAPKHLIAFDCDCSICSMRRNTHFIVPQNQFELKTGEADLTLYQFNTRTAKHLFCRHCGVQSYYVRVTRVYILCLLERLIAA